MGKVSIRAQRATVKTSKICRIIRFKRVEPISPKRKVSRILLAGPITAKVAAAESIKAVL